MAVQNLQEKVEVLFSSSAFRRPFHLLSITLLSLLLPLSFLLLARLRCAQYLLPSVPDNTQPYIFFIVTFVLYAIPALLYLLVSLLTIATLYHSFTGNFTLQSQKPSPAFWPRVHSAWIILCTTQVCVGIGMEGSIAAGVDAARLGVNRSSLWSRVMFFLGLHETMLSWSRVVVKPVVDDTIFRAVVEEKWVEKVAMAMSFGSLWWWRLRGEIEHIVIMTEGKKEMTILGMSLADFGCWFLYHLVEIIGIVRIMKSLLIGKVLVGNRYRRNSWEFGGVQEDV